MGLVAALLGKPLMEWQQHVANVLLEIDPVTGQLVYDEWILTVPRQSGKSTLILAKATHRCSATKFFGPRQQLVYTAQTRAKARKKWEEDYVADLQAAAKFKHKVDPRLGNGNEHLRFANGSSFGIEANTEKAGHGGTLDEAYIDEAFAQADNRLEQAFGPAMITRANKQLGIISTAGWLDASPYLLAKVLMGRKLVEDDVRVGTAYFEWSAPDDADPADEDVWLACMPALHRRDCPPRCKAHTVTLDAIRNEYTKAVRSGKLTDFCRAYLNQWKPKPREGEETALGNWAACKTDRAFPDRPSAIGLAVSIDRTRVSIGAAAMLEDGTPIVGPADTLAVAWPDVDGLVAEVKRIQTKHDCAVVVDKNGPGSDLIAKLQASGVTVTEVDLAGYVAACADMYDRVHGLKIAHRAVSDLDEAVAGARWRLVGDRRVFGRKASASDVSMLEAVTLALSATSPDYDVLDSIG